MNIRRHIAFLAWMLLFANSIYAQSWENLISDNILDIWEKRNGTAEYKVEGDQIIGISKLGTNSTYLCTRERFSDFMLEVEVIEFGAQEGFVMV